MANEPAKRILIVDDEPMLREVVEFEMVELGFQTLFAENGKQAIEIVKQNKIDAVISDIRMPGGNGVDLLDDIKAYNVEVPVVILMTGFSDLTLEDAYDKGAVAMFAKPLDLAGLKQVICEALTPKLTRWADSSREHLNFSAIVELSCGHSEQIQRGNMLNLGNGGMFVKVTEMDAQPQTKVNDQVKFKVKFTDSNIPPIEGHGIIRWMRTRDQNSLPRGMGIEFKFLSASCRQTVDHLIHTIQPRAYIPKT